MKRILKFSIFIFACFIVFNSCKKYEDGPAISLLSAKSRVAGNWKVYKFMINGKDSTNAFLNGGELKVNIAKDGLYNISGLNADQGTWRFEDNKESIVFRSSDPASTEEEKYKIKRLKSKQMWLYRDVGNGYNYEMWLQQ